MTTPPLLLYKYLDAEGAIKTLENCSLKFSSPLELNDPFEGLFGDIPDGYVTSLIKKLHLVQDSPEDWVRIFKDRLGIPCEKALILRECLGEKLSIEQIVRNTIKEYDAIRENHHRKTLGKVAFCSFSETKNSILMWAHYAKDYQGCVLGFNTEYFGPWYKVRYSSERIPQPMSSEEMHLVSVDSLRTKSTAWEYEQEWRIICPAEELEEREFIRQDVTSCEKEKVKYRVMDMKQRLRSLTEIILGVRVEEKVKKAAMAFIQNNSTCKLFQTMIHSNDYKIVINPVVESAG